VKNQLWVNNGYIVSLKGDSNGGNGGDGGNILLNLDPAVGDSYQFDYSNKGGRGGIKEGYP
jgi:hypothetical protein